MYNLDPERIGVWGRPPAGTWSRFWAPPAASRISKDREITRGFPNRVQAVVDFFGPTDFLQMDAHAVQGSTLKHDPDSSPESKLIGGAIQENPEKVGRANPIRYVTKETPLSSSSMASRTRSCPPIRANCSMRR